jgi:putative pyoverdin transport system ATP-binding/permease protein
MAVEGGTQALAPDGAGGAAAPPAPRRGGAFARLVAFLWGASPWRLLLSSLAGLVSGVTTVGLVAFFGRAIARSSRDEFSVGAFLALCGLMVATKVASEALFLRASASATFALRMRLGRAILAGPLPDLERVGPARLLGALTEGATTLAQALSVLSSLLADFLLTVACVAYLGVLSPRLLLAVLAFMALGVASYRAILSVADRRFEAFFETQGALQQILRGLVEGGKQLKLHAPRRDAFYERRLAPTARLLRDRLWSAIRVFAVSNQWGALLFLAAIGLVLHADAAAGLLPAGARAGATVTLLYLTLPLRSVLGSIEHVSRAATALRDIERFGVALDVPPGGAAGARAAEGARPAGRIELRGVERSYRRGEDGAFTLGPLDFELRPGEIVFVVGGNGSGKSTLVKLLVGLYPPDRGEVLFDGRPVAGGDVDWYREQFSVVFADHQLFDGLYGLEGPGLEARARAELARFGLEREVRLEARSFSTTELSQGQKKRLALAVSLLEGRPVVVYDEPAAEQDPAFKDEFYRQILPGLRQQGKAVVVVTHDDRYFSIADRVLTLEDGKLRS